MRTLLSFPYLNLCLYEGSVPVLELEWLRYANSADFRAAALQALHFTQQYHVQGWVADDRQLGAVRPRDLEWAAHTILVPLGQHGLKRFAQLEPLDALNRRTVGAMYISTQPSLQFEHRHFDDLAQARLWASGEA
ncbi:MAG: hypothetical protein ACRYFX_21965 [Janthinobacterium lividum]